MPPQHQGCAARGVMARGCFLTAEQNAEESPVDRLRETPEKGLRTHWLKMLLSKHIYKCALKCFEFSTNNPSIKKQELYFGILPDTNQNNFFLFRVGNIKIMPKVREI